MKMSVLVCAMLCLFMTTKSAHAQQLADLQHIAVVIADLGRESESIGLTKQSLADTVLAGLKRNVPNLKIDSIPPVSVFYVQVTTVGDGTASFISMSVVRPGEIAGDDGSKVYSAPMTVWHRGTLLTGSNSTMALAIRDYVNEGVTAFASQYEKDNLPSVFNGTWKVNLNTAKFPEKPDEYLLKDGIYQCKTCAPPIEVEADGQDHKVTGYPYFDTYSVKVVDDRTIETTDKKDGKTVATSKVWVSPDGNTLMFEFSDSSGTNADPATWKGQSMRVAKGPAGSHAISGLWRASKIDSVSDSGLAFTLKVIGDALEMTSQTGQNYRARLDGTDAPYLGDPGTTSVSVKKKGPNTIEETDKRSGTVIGVTVMTVSADGKTMKIANEDKLHGTNSQIEANKQLGSEGRYEDAISGAQQPQIARDERISFPRDPRPALLNAG